MSLGISADRWPARHNVECAELLSVMQEQEIVCKRLLELSQFERVALADGRIDDLEGTTREKINLVDRMEHLERRRRLLVDGVALKLGLAGETSLTDLASRLNPQLADDLLRIRNSFVSTISSLKEFTDCNITLMQKSLDLVSESIRQMRRAIGTGDEYTSNGKLSLNIKGNIAVDYHA